MPERDWIGLLLEKIEGGSLSGVLQLLAELEH